MRIIFIFLLSLFRIVTGFSQVQPLRDMIEAGRATGQKFEPVKLLEHTISRQAAGYGNYHVLSLKQDIVTRLLTQAPTSITLQLPVSENETLEMELMKVDNGYVSNITTNNSSQVSIGMVPQFYRGIVKGVKGKSSVALTVSVDMLSIFASYDGTNIGLQKSMIDSGKAQFVLYNSKEIKLSKGLRFRCDTKDPPADSIIQDPAGVLKKTAGVNDYKTACVYVFYDCDDSMYIHFNNSVPAVVNYVYEIFNQIALAYQNEGINVKIAKINVWTGQTPFNPTQLLESFADYYKENFFGNVAVCLDWGLYPGRKAGIAAAMGRFKSDNANAGSACNAYTPSVDYHRGAYVYCDLNYFGNYANFPIQADEQQVYLVTHEMGHLFGSPHTQWCGWPLSTDPPTLGALDNCVGTEGGCAPGPTPINGGTFMSYCIYDGEFVNFNNGFGQEPGDQIRKTIGNSSCLSQCYVCVADLTLGGLSADNSYHFEAVNSITINGSVTNTTKANLDAGSRIVLAPGFSAKSGCILHAYIDGCGGNR